MHHDDDGILYLCRSEVEKICQDIDSVAVIRNVFEMHHTNQTVLPDEAYLPWVNQKNESVRNLSMPAYVGGSLGMAGTKIINGNIHNPERGLPRASGVTLLYDNVSARVMCIMEGAYISSLRTASVSALSIDILKGPDVSCAAVIGAGALAAAHIQLLAKRVPQLQLIKIFDLDKARIQALQSELAATLQMHNVELQAASTAEEAIRSAQIIIPVTTTTEGYIPFSWLQPGSLLVNVSLDDPLPDVVFQANSVIVDDWNLVKNDPRRLIGRMYRKGQIIGPDEPGEPVSGERRKIDAQLGDIVSGAKVGRRQDSDIVLVNPFGLAIEDIALATMVYRKGRELGIGTSLQR
ncbi:MAG TPA: ornithine cyclodeaminase family protein [Ktedonobacteraceae bacterium]|nr:ornithine cyclodeaminase family protein [Ktedonobacteraceae bacterium]